ncbi:MAG: FAD-binding oxidoreductase [Gemmatimonadota bacterium]|nr:FAD-binding oxidoreductase [Gemmatimonadota bacterium]
MSTAVGRGNVAGVKPEGFRGVFRDDDSARAVYAEGAGIARAMPAAVAVPDDADDVATLVRWAAESTTSLIARGSGSGMAGGAVGPGIIVDLSRIDFIGKIDTERRRVMVGPGALRGAVNEAARGKQLRFPVDPSSGAFCTIGGMAATNAAGAHTLRYGATRAWVTALDCIFDDGSRARIERGAPLPDVAAVERFLNTAHSAILAAPARVRSHTGVRKDSSGYALADYARSGELLELLIGSEGTLALFVGIELSLAALPGATSSLVAEFPTLEQAVDGAARARIGGASACELLDRTFIDVARSGPALVPIDSASEAVLLIEIEAGNAAAAASTAQVMEQAMVSCGATRVTVALNSEDEARLWALRHAASPILNRLSPSLKSMQFIEDTAMPPERLPQYVRGVREILARHDVRGVIFGHAGDSHVHVNPLIDVRSLDWRETVGSILDEVTSLTAQLGGTLAGEHGDGRLRTPLLERVWDARSVALFAQVKRAFDPQNIFNPGVKVSTGGNSIDDVKYDPTLPQLPLDARTALDTIERDRAWSNFRLSMIGGR